MNHQNSSNSACNSRPSLPSSISPLPSSPAATISPASSLQPIARTFHTLRREARCEADEARRAKDFDAEAVGNESFCAEVQNSSPTKHSSASTKPQQKEYEMSWLTSIRPVGRIDIIDETPDLLIINKPPFLLVHPTKPGGPLTLWDKLKELLAYEITTDGQVSLINRIDRETSGIVLVAKNHAAARTCAMAMERGAIAKEYLALVYGWIQEDNGSIDAPLLRLGDVAASKIWLKRGIHPTGAPALTHFQVEQRLLHPKHGAITLVRCFPRTGRTHQIRVHLASLGHPIIGDKIYGPSEDCYLEFIQTGWTPSLAEKLWLPRHALHASVLEFIYQEKQYRWESPLPPDLLEFIKECDK